MLQAAEDEGGDEEAEAAADLPANTDNLPKGSALDPEMKVVKNYVRKTADEIESEEVKKTTARSRVIRPYVTYLALTRATRRGASFGSTSRRAFEDFRPVKGTFTSSFDLNRTLCRTLLRWKTVSNK